MTTALAIPTGPATGENFQAMNNWLEQAKNSGDTRKITQKNGIREIVGRLKAPCSSMWFTKRITGLLSNYYVPGAGDDQIRVLLGSWQRELSGCPAWALDKAIEYWLGRRNPYRHRRPVPGDISELIYADLGTCRMAENTCWERANDVVFHLVFDGSNRGAHLVRFRDHQNLQRYQGSCAV